MEKKPKCNIILIGFMGSGKTSVGKRLAKKLSCSFQDTDQLIEEKSGITIKHMFETKGEEYFREYETNLLRELKANLKNTVLSTGGGMPLREQNAELLKQLGHVIYLKVQADTVLKRLEDDLSRPLLQQGDRRMRIEQLLTERAPRYERAAYHIVETDGKSVDEIIDDIIQICIF